MEEGGGDVVGTDYELGEDVTMGSVCEGDSDDEGAEG